MDKVKGREGGSQGGRESGRGLIKKTGREGYREIKRGWREVGHRGRGTETEKKKERKREREKERKKQRVTD